MKELSDKFLKFRKQTLDKSIWSGVKYFLSLIMGNPLERFRKNKSKGEIVKRGVGDILNSRGEETTQGNFTTVSQGKTEVIGKRKKGGKEIYSREKGTPVSLRIHKSHPSQE